MKISPSRNHMTSGDCRSPADAHLPVLNGLPATRDIPWMSCSLM